ncbi:hypothetical protein DCS_04407 [Drechmeria coniospora]|uniref:Cyclin-like F-box n=1 Tax=Drechmeria coniospora TaxID=98403 RepID=A0A151GJY2_DRECN|nr:hypothetical protein DCS_04407 [Drechmeria coniospora]KYK57398.1 hypothetical protein DCS_04407 [Drechmeria coniospora]
MLKTKHTSLSFVLVVALALLLFFGEAAAQNNGNRNSGGRGSRTRNGVGGGGRSSTGGKGNRNGGGGSGGKTGGGGGGGSRTGGSGGGKTGGGGGRTGGGRTGGGRTGGGGKSRATQSAGGISTAQDGSTILDQTVQINGLPIRYKVSAPANQFTTTSGVQGGTAAANDGGSIGMNVLLHGDGGQSFFDFPNQGVRANLMGVAVLSPDKNGKWGGADRNGQERPDGVAHSQAVADLVTQELPKVVAFNRSQVFFTGVSGGALTLSGFFMPGHMDKFPNTGVLLNCGAMAPQVSFNADAAAAMANTRIHFQSTKKELDSLQESIPQSIAAYEQAAANAGLGRQQTNTLQTVDNSPNGGHCEFDERGFVSGVQLMADNFENIMLPGASGQVTGVGNVNRGVPDIASTIPVGKLWLELLLFNEVVGTSRCLDADEHRGYPTAGREWPDVANHECDRLVVLMLMSIADTPQQVADTLQTDASGLMLLPGLWSTAIA